MALNSSVIRSTSDLRSAAVEQRRSKERRVKYRNVNANLIGTPQWSGGLKTAPDWDDRNKFKMTRDPLLVKICHCHSCRPWNTKERSKKRAVHKAYMDDEICSARKNHLSPTSGGDDCWDDSSSSDSDLFGGVTYSYDRTTGPRGGTDILSYAVTEAVKKFENKELATLIKNEYEVVDSEDSDEEFELI